LIRTHLAQKGLAATQSPPSIVAPSHPEPKLARPRVRVPSLELPNVGGAPR
jgi:hypothetical protein